MALPKFYKVCQDQNGNIVPQVLCSVFNHGTAVLASLYQDDAGTLPLANPMTSDAQYGSVKFYVNPGHYDLSFTKPGYTFEPIYDMQVPADTVTLGTMATQNAHAVAITGGSATGLTSLAATGGLSVGGASTMQGAVGIGGAPAGNNRLLIWYDKATTHGIWCQPTGTDAGTIAALAFFNVAGAQIGSITTTGAATAYNTSSDSRLKRTVEGLSHALDVVRRLRPVRFRWTSTDEAATGFLAEEVAQVVDGVTTGTPGAVHANGQINPMQMDPAKLTPWVVAGLQEVLTRLEALEGRLRALEAAATARV